MKVATDFLPLGSVVITKAAIKNGTNLEVMIVQRAGFVDEKYYDYGAIPFPDGIDNSARAFYFNADDIAKVEFKGLDDEDNKEYVAEIKESVANPSDVKAAAKSSRSKNPLDRLPKLKEDSFLYKLVIWFNKWRTY